MRVTHKLECPIDEAEIANAKNAHARMTLEYERLEEEAKERASTDRKTLKGMWDEILELAAKSQRGVAMKDVKCEERIDLDRGKRIVIRLDTGKEVEELEKPYVVENEEPLTAAARKKAGAGNGGAASKPSKPAEPPGQTTLPATATVFPPTADGLVVVLDVTGKERRVKANIAEAIMVANAKGLPVIHAFDDDPNVELAMVLGQAVYGVDKAGNEIPLSAKQIRIFREAFRAKTAFNVAFKGGTAQIVGLKGGPMIGDAAKGAKKSSVVPMKGKGTKKSSKKPEVH